MYKTPTVLCPKEPSSAAAKTYGSLSNHPTVVAKEQDSASKYEFLHDPSSGPVRPLEDVCKVRVDDPLVTFPTAIIKAIPFILVAA
jgi:hypothetical protein